MVERRSDAILARLMGLHPKVIDLSLDRTLDLLDRLGRPQDHLPPVVHVAGTNGKGSTIAFMRAILEQAGYRVHVYTSPHLVKFAERIRLAGEVIPEEKLSALLEHCEEVNEGVPITFFEITTCAGFKAFADTPGDVVLLETGLGGRLDSTNVVANPAVTVITPVSMDHPQFLGNTVEAIAGEKAAIQKSGTPSVIGPQPDTAMTVIDDYAQSVNAPLARFGAEWQITETADGLQFTSAPLSIDLPKPGLLGRHQTANAGMAIAAMLELRDQGFEIPDDAIRQGLAKATWPARLQRLKKGPIVDDRGPDWEVWLDGGHNAAAGEALADWMEQQKRDLPLYIIFGMLNTKAAGDFLKPLAPHVAKAWSIAIPGEENSLTAQESCDFAREQSIECIAADSVEQALGQLPDGPARLLICGSLYLAGVILSEND